MTGRGRASACPALLCGAKAHAPPIKASFAAPFGAGGFAEAHISDNRFTVGKEAESLSSQA